MALIPENAFQNSIASLPLVTFQAGETVIADGSRTGRLLILRTGSVAIVKKGIEIATVAEPGAAFGELSALLDQPHAADVRALEASQFHIADAAALFAQNPVAALYVATVLARRLNAANHILIQLKTQLQSGEPPRIVVETVSKMEQTRPLFLCHSALFLCHSALRKSDAGAIFSSGERHVGAPPLSDAQRRS